MMRAPAFQKIKLTVISDLCQISSFDSEADVLGNESDHCIIPLLQCDVLCRAIVADRQALSLFMKWLVMSVPRPQSSVALAPWLWRSTGHLVLHNFGLLNAMNCPPPFKTGATRILVSSNFNTCSRDAPSFTEEKFLFITEAIAVTQL